jgi:hypothetical protein
VELVARARGAEEQDVSEAAGQVNRYDCQSCGDHIVTVNVVEGVTPFMISHRDDAGSVACSGRMYSCFYRVDQDLEPTHEWYRPTRKQVVRRFRRQPDVLASMLEHVEKGGLDLRPATKELAYNVLRPVNGPAPESRPARRALALIQRKLERKLRRWRGA